MDNRFDSTVVLDSAKDVALTHAEQRKDWMRTEAYDAEDAASSSNPNIVTSPVAYLT